MKIYAERDDGSKIEIEEIETVGSGDIILVQIGRNMLPAYTVNEFRDELEQITGKKAILIPPYAEIIGIISAGPGK